MSSSVYNEAVTRGVGFLEAFLAVPEHFRAHWTDFVFEFSNIARCAGDEALRHRAGRLVETWVETARRLDLRLPASPTFEQYRKAAVALLGSRAAGLDPVDTPERIRGAGRQLLHRAGRAGRALMVSDARSMRRCHHDLISTYVGWRVGVPLVRGYGEELSRALSLRPYVEPDEIHREALRHLGLVVTHIVYTASRYNELALDPELLAPERDFMLRSLPQHMTAGDCEVVGEYLDALATCGVAMDHPELAAAAEWLVAVQGADGSWGTKPSTHSYSGYHPTLAVVQGLRSFRRTGEGPARPWIRDLLRHVRPCPSEVARLKSAPRNNRSSARHAVTRMDWPPPNNLLRDRALTSEPAVVSGCARACPAFSKWTDDYLCERVGDISLEIEVSPDRVFASPEREIERRTMTMRDFISGDGDADYRYLAQVDMSKSLSPLVDELPLDHLFPSRAEVQRLLWIAFGERITPLHYDRRQNLFVLFSGLKRFMLFPPDQGELMYAHEEARRAHFSRVDPVRPDLGRYPLFAKADPICVDLVAGDALIIPKGWWHHVRSIGRTVAVSYWWRVRRAPSEPDRVRRS